MVRIRPRNAAVIVEELSLFLSRRGLLTKMVREFKESADIIAGAVEFLVGEGLARLFDVEFYFNDSPQAENYVFWNGSIDLKNLTFRHAPRGVPDLEISLKDEKAVVEVSFGIHPQTVISEIKEVINHNPRSFWSEPVRILLVPERVAYEASTFLQSRQASVDTIPIEVFLNTLQKEYKNISSLKNFIKISKECIVEGMDASPSSGGSLFEVIWEEISSGRVIFGFTILRLMSEVLNNSRFRINCI
ncbi:hypothetical protein DRP04_07660 [Archaeoglobales archaeon]|nr:MAG: hypothetical protein DRP04_07660 [Archaeoglobales archaeon]